MQAIEADTKKSRVIMLLAFGVILLLLAAIYFFVRPKVITYQPVNQSGLAKFSFERNTPDGERVKCTMKREDGAARVMLYDSQLGGKRERTMDISELAKLQEMIVREGIYKLDAYYERGPVVGSKNAFTLTIRYENERNVNASGVTLLPEGIDQTTAAIKAYFYALFIDD